MYQRADGIVEFDPNACIGCKACLQACPYDAIYIDPETHSAAKCHFCAHRTDIGLKPACEVVCPEAAIISGDLDDPDSTISRLIAREPVSVRKPEQGTAPKLFYIDVAEVTLTPTVAHMHETFFWADVATDQARALADVRSRQREVIPLESADPTFQPSNVPTFQRLTTYGTPIRTPREQGMGAGASALLAGGRVAGQMVQTAYNAQHNIPWHWPVPAYLVTKSIGSGTFLAVALAAGLGLATLDGLFTAAALSVALLLIGITTGLLVYDLEKPRMFITILTRPQWRSWLTRGAFALIAFAVVAGLWFVIEAGGVVGLVGPALVTTLRVPLAWIGFPLALLAAIYTAFLFAQAEGRDLWQSPLLPVHLAIQAFMAGAGMLFILGSAGALAGLPLPPGMPALLAWLFGVSLALDLFVTLVGEFGIPHASEIAARAAYAISHGRYRRWFWGGSVMFGHILPLALLLLAVALPDSGLPALALAGLAAIIGLYAFEYAFVMAPQEIPNS
jgi:formate-dependent nitrite reductase membrane component NrfD/ferredoxin